MKIKDLIKQLQTVQAEYGNIEVTCTGSTLPDDHAGPIPDVYETTVETLVIRLKDDRLPTRVRLYL